MKYYFVKPAGSTSEFDPSYVKDENGINRQTYFDRIDPEEFIIIQYIETKQIDPSDGLPIFIPHKVAIKANSFDRKMVDIYIRNLRLRNVEVVEVNDIFINL